MKNTIFAVIVICASIMGVFTCGNSMKQGIEQTDRESYHAWSKLTGNPKQLTFEEFRHLPPAAKK